MAITNLIDNFANARIADATIKVGSAYTELIQIKDASAKPVFESISAKGRGTFAVSTRLDHVELTFSQAVIPLAVMRQLLGAGASVTSGADPSLVETQSFKTTDIPVYFQLTCLANDITGMETLTANNAVPADMHIIFPQCKLTSAPEEILPTANDFAVVKFNAWAVADANDIVWQYVTHQASTALPLV